MSSLKYASSKKGDVLIIKLGGSLDLNTAPKLNDKLSAEIKKGAQKVVLNLEQVEYLASAGLGAIISAKSALVKNGGELRLSSMTEKITRIFKLMGFIHLFKSYRTDDEAVKSF